MIKEQLVSKTVAEELHGLGFREKTLYEFRRHHMDIKWSTVDEAIDFIRRKYNVVIYNAMEPFVDPTSKKPVILFRYKIKWCNLRDGWNGRCYIGSTELTKHPSTGKKTALRIAIKWIKQYEQTKSRKSTAS